MVNLHFPPTLTEEELMLQAKYEKLRKKKKALEKHKSPKVEAERPIIKRPKMEAKNAREIAKKLLKSGAIAAIQKAQRREEQGSGFKRPCGLERKLERNMNSYQPFSSANSETEERTPIKKLYTSEPVEGKESTAVKLPPINQPRTGQTIFVSVANSADQSLTEDCLVSVFSACGRILDISLEPEKNRGCVTFDTTEAAAAAISMWNGRTTPNNFQLKVSYSRRQPTFKSSSYDTSSGPVWSTGTNQVGGKENSKEDHRNVVFYGDNPFLD